MRCYFALASYIMIQGNIQMALQVVRTAVCHTLGRIKNNNICVKVVYFPIWYKWQGWNENPGVSMKIYHLLKNPIIRHSGSSILEKLPILRVIITIQHANCFSIRRLCFQWVLLSITGLHLNCYLMKANLIKGQHHLRLSIVRKALSEALKFGNILGNRLLLKYCIFQGHSKKSSHPPSLWIFRYGTHRKAMSKSQPGSSFCWKLM